MSTFYLVRHGHADWTNDENRPLSTRGREESNHVADVLQKYPIGAIYSSPFRRAYETISPLSKRLSIPVHIEPDLRERKIGSHTIEDFNTAIETMWRAPLFSPPEGESNSAAQHRGLAVLQRLRKENMADHMVFSTHGNLIALILNYFNPSIDFTFWKSLTVPDIYILRINQVEGVSMSRLWDDNNP